MIPAEADRHLTEARQHAAELSSPTRGEKLIRWILPILLLIAAATLVGVLFTLNEASGVSLENQRILQRMDQEADLREHEQSIHRRRAEEIAQQLVAVLTCIEKLPERQRTDRNIDSCAGKATYEEVEVTPTPLPRSRSTPRPSARPSPRPSPTSSTQPPPQPAPSPPSPPPCEPPDCIPPPPTQPPTP